MKFIVNEKNSLTINPSCCSTHAKAHCPACAEEINRRNKLFGLPTINFGEPSSEDDPALPLPITNFDRPVSYAGRADFLPSESDSDTLGPAPGLLDLLFAEQQQSEPERVSNPQFTLNRDDFDSDVLPLPITDYSTNSERVHNTVNEIDDDVLELPRTF